MIEVTEGEMRDPIPSEKCHGCSILYKSEQSDHACHVRVSSADHARQASTTAIIRYTASGAEDLILTSSFAQVRASVLRFTMPCGHRGPKTQGQGGNVPTGLHLSHWQMPHCEP